MARPRLARYDRSRNAAEDQRDVAEEVRASAELSRDAAELILQEQRETVARYEELAQES